MLIDKTVLSRMLVSAAAVWEEQADYLSRIDSRFGDGDHGVTILKIARLISARVPEWKEESPAEFLDDLGTAVMEIRGGSAGPLYGTLIGGLGAQIGSRAELDGAGAKDMLTGCLAEMQDLTPAGIGDKTMMDALIPAVQAAARCEGDAKAVWQAAAQAAEEGAKASEGYIAKFGRAKSYKEQTIGTPDAGAVSTALFLRGMADGI